MELNKKQLGTIITLAALISGVAGGAISYDSDSTYYCESRDIVMDCDRLSSTAKTCYYANTSKRCTEGWQSIDGFVEVGDLADIVKVNANGKEWSCQAIDGFVQSYSRCTSGVYEGYLGELV